MKYLYYFYTWVNGATNNTTKWIPCSVIEPIMEIVETLFSQESCCTIVEVRIKFMDNTLEPQN